MQKYLYFTIFITLLSPPLHAHKAHSHSEARVSLAFDGPNGVFEAEFPAIALVDFEHKPKNSVQKIKLQKALESLAQSVDHILTLDTSLKCLISSPKSDVVYSGKNNSHSEFKLSAQVQCNAQPTLGMIKLKLLTQYPKLQRVEIQTLIGDQQKSFVLSGDQESLN